ncbi:condensin-2 complex subunit H2-like [Gigantopelta aegis]|uniref:condensin-2 complex subunit H2-like n=1 Tax=Gigantopelta aegis TaxID=1735272 RepID=UPI001B888F92|nr:condensin-2 complex subunit H2-like [Gigantopelta aegis]
MVVGNSSKSDAEQRFAHLLQPIRDLSKNWDIDIASYLDEYLDELESVAITFDGGATTMNFAEAALLIQGSACVYSRKVEYLCTLVYQVLDLLANKKSKKQSSVDENGNDVDANFEDDEDEQFLSLDDIGKAGNITLKEGEDVADKSIHPMPKTPMSLVVLDEGAKGDNPLLSKTGEILASRNDFKMNTCHVHPSGTMLLDSSHINLLELSLKLLASSTPCTFLYTQKKTVGSQDACSVHVDLPPVECHAADMSVDDCGQEPFHMEEMEDHCEDFQKNIEEPLVRKSERRRVQLMPPKPVVDPWKECDPHDAVEKGLKAFKKGKVLKIESVTRRKRKRHPAIKDDEPVSKFIAEAIYSHRLKDLQKVKVASFPELEQLYWPEMKRRQSELRKEKTLMISQGIEPEEDEEEIENCLDDGEPVAAGLLLDDDPGDPYDDLLGQMSDHILFPIVQPPVNLDIESQDDIEFEKDVLVTSYEDLVRKHVEAYMASAQEYAQVTELSQRVAEWEEKIIPKLRHEESHEPFDIHKYGSKVIKYLKMNTKIAFRKIVCGCDDFEICRLFLATLQLANVGNVLVSCDGILEKGIDKMALELLSTRRHYEELAEYQAPSVK